MSIREPLDLTVRIDRSGEVTEFRQPPIEPSSYQARLAAGEDPLPVPQSDDQDPSSEKGAEPLGSNDLRYWSDYNRVDYHPRTIQPLPDVADWENVDGNWSLGKETFERYNTVCAYYAYGAKSATDIFSQDTSLMEEPFRQFVEECDALQVKFLYGGSTVEDA